MRIDCNEQGFTKENVKAICSIGQTTKISTDRKKGFIGEKGIGFKSVFKVADIVHISSGAFQFKFDRRATLGMIAPIAERFPREHTIAEQTQMLLYLKGRDELNQIDADFQDIKPEILMFLRKLSCIKIHTSRRQTEFKISRDCYDPKYRGETAILTVSNTVDSVTRLSRTRYIIVRQKVRDLPNDERREGVNESEVVLAFPVAEDTKPVAKNQEVYAYLPINDEGFQVSS
jgi:hypothetical protein